MFRVVEDLDGVPVFSILLFVVNLFLSLLLCACLRAGVVPASHCGVAATRFASILRGSRTHWRAMDSTIQNTATLDASSATQYAPSVGVFTQMTRHQNFDVRPGTDWTIFLVLSIGRHGKFYTHTSKF